MHGNQAFGKWVQRWTAGQRARRQIKQPAAAPHAEWEKAYRRGARRRRFRRGVWNGSRP